MAQLFVCAAFALSFGGYALPRQRFTGGLLGVSASVELDMRTERATIRLSGIPLGGTLEGTARFSDGEGSSVEIEEPLKTALRRRLVSVVDARFDRDLNQVFVTVNLPFLLGRHTIRLDSTQPLTSFRAFVDRYHSDVF